MTQLLCLVTWLYAINSPRNKSTGLCVVAFLALVSSCGETPR